MDVPKTRYAEIDDNGIEQVDGDASVRDELSKQDVLDSFERGFRQMLDGQTRPALEFLDELDNE